MLRQDPWKDDDWFERQLFVFRSNGVAWSLSLHDDAASEQGDQPTVTWAWSGAEWIETRANNTVIFEPLIPSNVEFDCIGLFNGCEAPTAVTGADVADLLTKCELLDSRQDGFKCTYRLAADDRGVGIVTLAIITYPEFVLESLEYDLVIPDGQDNAGEVKLRLHYHVAEWGPYDGLLLPKVAYRDGYLLRQHEAEAGHLAGR